MEILGPFLMWGTLFYKFSACISGRISRNFCSGCTQPGRMDIFRMADSPSSAAAYRASVRNFYCGAEISGGSDNLAAASVFACFRWRLLAGIFAGDFRIFEKRTRTCLAAGRNRFVYLMPVSIPWNDGGLHDKGHRVCRNLCAVCYPDLPHVYPTGGAG